MNPTDIQNRFDSILDPGYQEFIESGETEVIANLLAEPHELDSRSIRALENAIDLYLLLLLNREELIYFIQNQCGLTPEESVTLAAAIDLALPNDIRFARAITEEALTSAHNDLETDIAATEAALQQLPPTRTMAGDAQVLQKHNLHEEPPVYQSTQPILRPGNPLRGPNAPTWGDD